ncbi:MAG: LysR substrate-binding domain-containing protein [Bacteroidales bacterium]|jgi:LysR family hydrogen peroxide-inducible transcriptional activator|nr:LysR substrate-binding domain-containing protein [Bacteroidales bacterium]
MTLNQLKYLVAISKFRSFSKASHMLGVSQPALTSQVKKLEEELGFTIFNRTKVPIAITPEGELLRKRAEQLIGLSEDMYNIAIELEEKVSGKLVVGVIPTVAPYLTSILMDDLQNAFPDLYLNVKELITEEIVEQVRNGEIDAGIIATPIQAKGVIFKPLFYEKFYLFVSDKNKLYAKNTINISQIDLNELWYLKEGNCFQNQVNALCKIAEDLARKQHFKYQSNSIESLRYVVEQRGGVTFVPELATLNVSPEKENMIKEIEGLKPVREISLISAKFLAKKKLIDAFVSVLLDNIPPRMKSLQEGMILDTQIIAD